MVSNYTELRDMVRSIINRPDTIPSIPRWIYLCEQELNSLLHRREMTQRATATTVAGQAGYALPDNFGEAIGMHLTTSGASIELQPSEWDYVSTAFPNDARPTHWAIAQNQFLLGPTPDAAYTLELYYYKTIPNLSGSSPTNWLLSAYPKVYLYGTLNEAATASDDPRAAKWASAYQSALKVLLHDQIRERSFGGGPTLRADVPFGNASFGNIFSGE